MESNVGVVEIGGMVHKVYAEQPKQEDVRTLLISLNNVVDVRVIDNNSIEIDYDKKASQRDLWENRLECFVRNEEKGTVERTYMNILEN